MITAPLYNKEYFYFLSEHLCMKFKPSYLFFGVFALCFAGFTYLEDTVRANYTGNSDIIIYVLGFIPNYLPAVGIPCFFYAALPHVCNKQSSILTSRYAHIYVLIFSQSGLIIWEFAQIFLPRGTFDVHDILWTMIGGFTFFLFWLYHSKKYGTLLELK